MSGTQLGHGHRFDEQGIRTPLPPRMEMARIICRILPVQLDGWGDLDVQLLSPEQFVGFLAAAVLVTLAPGPDT